MGHCRLVTKAGTWRSPSAVRSRRWRQRAPSEWPAKITMPAVRVVGWRVSSTSLAHGCGRPFRNPMPRLERMQARKISMRSAGQTAPVGLRVPYSQGLRSETSPRNRGGLIPLTGCLQKTQAATRCGGRAPATPPRKMRSPLQADNIRRGLPSRFLRSQPRRIGLGCPRQARVVAENSVRVENTDVRSFVRSSSFSQ